MWGDWICEGLSGLVMIDWNEWYSGSRRCCACMYGYTGDSLSGVRELEMGVLLADI